LVYPELEAVMSSYLLIEAADRAGMCSTCWLRAEVDPVLSRVRDHPELYGSVDFELQRAGFVAMADGSRSWPLWRALLKSRGLQLECEMIANATTSGLQ
jgi:hypothetical protein